MAHGAVDCDIVIQALRVEGIGQIAARSNVNLAPEWRMTSSRPSSHGVLNMHFKNRWFRSALVDSRL